MKNFEVYNAPMKAVPQQIQNKDTHDAKCKEKQKQKFPHSSAWGSISENGFPVFFPEYFELTLKIARNT